MSSLEAFSLSHVSLEELEKQVWSSLPVNRACMAMQASRISWAMQCCHLLPAGGHLCVLGTLLVPGARGRHTGQGPVKPSLLQTHPGTHLPQNVCSLLECCAKMTSQQHLVFLCIFNVHSLIGPAAGSKDSQLLVLDSLNSASISPPTDPLPMPSSGSLSHPPGLVRLSKPTENCPNVFFWCFLCVNVLPD